MSVIQGQREGFRQQVLQLQTLAIRKVWDHFQTQQVLSCVLTCSPLISLRNRCCSKWTRARINNLGSADPACTPFSEQNPDTNSTDEQARSLHKTCKHYLANRAIRLRTPGVVHRVPDRNSLPLRSLLPRHERDPGGRRRGRRVCSPRSRNLPRGGVGWGGAFPSPFSTELAPQPSCAPRGRFTSVTTHLAPWGPNQRATSQPPRRRATSLRWGLRPAPPGRGGAARAGLPGADPPSGGGRRRVTWAGAGPRVGGENKAPSCQRGAGTRRSR